MTGILGSRSTLLSNTARFLNEPMSLKHTEKRLSRMLGNETIPWEVLALRGFDMASRCVGKNDIIAFDPGDVSKRYAKKMAHLHLVHDGSQGRRVLGYYDLDCEN